MRCLCICRRAIPGYDDDDGGHSCVAGEQKTVAKAEVAHGLNRGKCSQSHGERFRSTAAPLRLGQEPLGSTRPSSHVNYLTFRYFRRRLRIAASATGRLVAAKGRAVQSLPTQLRVSYPSRETACARPVVA